MQRLVDSASGGYELITYLGEWRDPSFLTLMLPLIVIPLVSILGTRPEDDASLADTFYTRLGRIQKNFDWV